MDSTIESNVSNNYEPIVYGPYQASPEKSAQASSGESEIESEKPANKRGRGKSYNVLGEFEEYSLALASILNCTSSDSQNPELKQKWTMYHQKKTHKGHKRFFKCSTIRDSKCPKVSYILKSSDSQRGTVYLSDDQHEHGTAPKITKIGILIADGANAITNGFEQVFGPCLKRVMCWFHMISKVDDAIQKHVNSMFSAEIRADICSIQVSTSTKIFEKAIQCFQNK